MASKCIAPHAAGWGSAPHTRVSPSFRLSHSSSCHPVSRSESPACFRFPLPRPQPLAGPTAPSCRPGRAPAVLCPSAVPALTDPTAATDPLPPLQFALCGAAKVTFQTQPHRASAVTRLPSLSRLRGPVIRLRHPSSPSRSASFSALHTLWHRPPCPPHPWFTWLACPATCPPPFSPTPRAAFPPKAPPSAELFDGNVHSQLTYSFPRESPSGPLCLPPPQDQQPHRGTC